MTGNDRILILRLSALGDVAMTLPVIYSVARAYPDVSFTLLTRPFFKRLFINAPANLSVMTFDPGSQSLIQIIRELRRERFTAIADLHDLLRTRVIAAGVSAGRRIRTATVNKDRRARKELTKGKSRTPQRSYIDRYMDVFAALGYPAELTFRSIFDGTDERHGVGIAPFARYSTKTYPPEKMEAVAGILTGADVPVYLFGARGDEERMLKDWAERNPALHVMAGKVPLEGELDAISRLQAMVTMDSANMHLASLVGTPVISIWGSTIPQCGFMGYRQKADEAIWADIACQPCSVAGLPECPLGHMRCMTDIAPEEIARRVLALLKR